MKFTCYILKDTIFNSTSMCTREVESNRQMLSPEIYKEQKEESKL